MFSMGEIVDIPSCGINNATIIAITNRNKWNNETSTVEFTKEYRIVYTENKYMYNRIFVEKDLVKNQSIEQYLKELEEQGYIANDGKPLKCIYCDSSEIEEINHIYEENILIEHEIECLNCFKITGLNIRDSWQIGGF